MEDDDEIENDADDLDDTEEATSEKSAETAASNDEKEMEKDNEERQLVMDKHFVLPKRSTRSSRIIKPNKRLLEVGGIGISSISKKNSNEVQTVKTKPKNYFGLGDFAADASTASTSSALSLKLGKETFSSFGSMKLNSSFVLRQPRLQFGQTDSSGPFSKSTGSGLLLAASTSASSSAISTTTNAISFGSHNSVNSGKFTLSLT